MYPLLIFYLHVLYQLKLNFEYGFESFKLSLFVYFSFVDLDLMLFERTFLDHDNSFRSKFIKIMQLMMNIV